MIELIAFSAAALLAPHVPRVLSYLAYHLEQKRPAYVINTQELFSVPLRCRSSHRLPILHAVISVLRHSSTLHDPVLSSRLARAILPSLAVILSPVSHVAESTDQTALKGRGRKGKKRARGYEGDEVFKVTREINCPTPDDGGVLISALRGGCTIAPNRVHAHNLTIFVQLLTLCCAEGN